MFNLPADVVCRVVWHIVGMVERHIEQNQRNVQLLRQVLIPFEHGITDIRGAENQIRQGNVLRLCMLQIHITHIDSGIGADICTVADALRVFDELHCLFSGADGCGMVFRIYRSQVHGVQQLVRTDGRRPDHRLSFRLCCKGTVVMLGGQLVQQFF